MLLAESVNLLPDKTFFVQLIFFVIVLFCLSRFVFKPLLKILALRRQHTEGERRKIETVAARTEAMMKEYEAKMAVARQQASQLKESIRREGEEAGAKLVQESKEVAKIQVEKVKQEIQKSVDQASADLEKQAKQLGTEIAGKILGRSLTGNGH